MNVATSATSECCEPGKSLHVLIVDDIRCTLELMVKLLQLCGVTTETAVNGKEAFQTLCARRPDIVITDHEMPVWNGSDLIRAMRASPDQSISGLPVVLMTAAGEDELPEDVRLQSDCHFLRKPISVDALQELLNRLSP